MPSFSGLVFLILAVVFGVFVNAEPAAPKSFNTGIYAYIGPEEGAPADVCRQQAGGLKLSSGVILFDGCALVGSSGFPATGSSMNKWNSGSSFNSFNCTGFVGSAKSLYWSPDTQCSTEPKTSEDITFAPCDTCRDVKKGRCADKCMMAGLYPKYSYEVDQYCKSPTDVCIVGTLHYME
jgi:hypothetical protein